MPHARKPTDRPALGRILTLVALAAACAAAMAAPPWRVTAMKPADTGSAPGGRLVALPDGNLYGTAQSGGGSNAGTVFAVNPKGHITTLHEFNGSDGYAPIAGLALGSDGMLYGTTALGAANGLGGVFRISTDGAFALLHSFDDSKDRGTSEVSAALALGPDGNFYGTAPLSAGYPVHNGTVFKVTPAGEVTVLYVFGVRARTPFGGVTFAPDGRLYGTASSDGRKGCGLLYSLAADGSDFRIEHQFGHNHSGCRPLSTLAADDEGRLFGTTQYGGRKGGVGVLFRFNTTSAVFDVLHVFHDDDIAGSNPAGGVSFGPDGYFYGATSFGTVSGNGSVFRATAEGNIAVVHEFAGDGSEGQGVQAAPVPDGDHHLVGGLLAQGRHDGGTIYRVKTAIAK
jgi:uncharacterized repeat protein (TIGR03803 family)